MESHIQAIATVISLMNPAICATMFASITQEQSKSEKVQSSLKVMLTILVVLSLSALFGAQVLKMFGISLDAFSAAGGTVLIWMGFSMLKNSSSQTSKKTDSSSSTNSLVLFAASPGTITGVITLSVSQVGSKLPISALIAILVSSLITLAVILLSIKFSTKNTSNSTLRETLTSFMGLIVLAMGFQFALSGLKNFFMN